MAELLTFLGVGVLVIVTPGQDTALTIRRRAGAARGRAPEGRFAVALGLRLAAAER